jgi:hypothetical protein
MRAEVELAANPFSDDDLQLMRMAIHKWVYDTPLAPGLPPIPDDIVVERSHGGLRFSFPWPAPAERDAWHQAMALVSDLVFDHVKAQGWSGVSVRRIDCRMTQ